MKVRLFSAAAMLAMACAVTATPVPDNTNTFPVSWADVEAGSQSAQRANQGQADKRDAYGGECEGQGSGCFGDVTHWEGGLGACGWTVNTESDFQIAMPVGMMGALSNSNPYCGRSLTIKNPITGATAQATVGDKCMGCTGHSIDLTNALFNAIARGCDGRCSGYEWWFD